MKAGNFNINDYLERLYEEAEQKDPKQTGFMDGGDDVTNSDGIVIPNENKKSYDWLKKEFQKGKVEVKVEMNIGGAKFEPGYDLQTNLDSVKDFKPGMYGEVKTADTKDVNKQKGEGKPSLDPKKDTHSFTKGEGDQDKKPLDKKPLDKKEGESTKTNTSDNNIKDKESGKKEKETEEDDEKDEKSSSKEKPEVKKIDLKTKKK
jgi:hypothetical protein